MLTYILPAEKHHSDVTDYIHEVRQYDNDFDGSAGLGNFPTYESWLERIRFLSSVTAENRGFIPTDVYLAYDEDRLVGIVSIRLTSDEFVRIYAGHIGYHVRPSCRHRGYGKQLLRLAVNICSYQGILPPVVCTDPDNIPSQKTALACGFVPAGEVIYRQERRILRFELK